METLEHIDELNKDIREKELHERQLQHRLKREQSKAAFQKRRNSPEYRARTHRLCDRGGTIEHFYPDTKDLTEEEFYELVDMLDHDLLIRQSWLKNVKEIMERREGVKV